MRYRKCGESDLELSILGAGCWSFGSGEYWGQQSQADTDVVVALSLDLGINYFDTAEVYNNGNSETCLGLALKGKRHKAVVGTKLSPSNAYPDKIIAHCNASLKRLGTDYIDLYMLHWPIHSNSIRHFTDDEEIINNPPLVDDVFATLIQLREQGKVRCLGVSNFAPNRLAEARGCFDQIVANELPYSLLTRAIEIEALPYCSRTDIGVIGYMTLLQGLLTDVERRPYLATANTPFRLEKL